MPGANWYVDVAGFQNVPGSPVTGGGGDTSVIQPRNILDGKRMAQGFAPGASWPDGYLGTITDRREDRLMTSLQTRLTERSYQRGVHVGEKLGAGQYYWTADCNPDSGIAKEARPQVVDQDGGLVMYVPRHVPTGNAVERLTALGGSATLPPEQQMQVSRQYGVDPGINPMPMTMTDPQRAASMRGLMPRWA